MTESGLSRSVEDYLKAIYASNSRGVAAGTSELAKALDVQPASVSGMVKKLAEEGMLEHERYHGVRLTERGEREALKILRRHRVIESYLVERLGYSWDDVHDEAERLEHAASDDLIDRMSESLGNPTTDPHGSPIPNRDGEIDRTHYQTLSATPPKTAVRIRSVSDDNPTHLRFLESVGMLPGTKVVVESVQSSDGTITVRVGPSGHVVEVEGSVASLIFVQGT